MLLHSIEKKLKKRRKITQILNSEKEAVEKLLSKAQAHKNAFLCLKCWEALHYFSIIELYNKVFSELKTKNYYDAWCNLERIEILYQNLKDNTINCDEFCIIKYIEEYTKKLQKLYPYKLFVSPEFHVKSMRCSICGKTINPLTGCTHIPGKVYMGELCFSIVEKMDFVTTAIVESPLQKYSVIFDDIHNPKKYLALEYFIPMLEEPFSNWDVNIYTEFIEDSDYDIANDIPCPCGSKKKYKDCCLSKLPLKPRPHFEFVKV